MNLDAQIEAVLFWKAEPVSVKKLASILGKNEDEIRAAIAVLKTALQNRGLTLIELENEVTLGTSKDISALIEKLTKEELVKDLGKAGLETLSIILYQGPVTRAEIDYIRGVNSQFILRNLLVRGLVDKVENPKDRRAFLYKSSFDLLSHLGVSNIADLPDYESVRRNIEAFKASAEEADKKEEASHGAPAEEQQETSEKTPEN